MIANKTTILQRTNDADVSNCHDYIYTRPLIYLEKFNFKITKFKTISKSIRQISKRRRHDNLFI